MNWLQQWLSNRQNKKSANPIDATNAANKWRNISNNLLVAEEPGTTFNTTEIVKDIIEQGNGNTIPKEKSVNEKVDELLSDVDSNILGTPKFDTTEIIEDITDFTEGPGTTLIQQEDGSVIRVPTGKETPGSIVIQVDDQPKQNEINYDIIPKDEDFKQGETAKAAWLYKTRNSPAAKAGHSDERRWQLHLKNKAFQEAKKNKTLDQFVQDYPNSPYSKERLRRR